MWIYCKFQQLYVDNLIKKTTYEFIDALSHTHSDLNKSKLVGNQFKNASHLLCIHPFCLLFFVIYSSRYIFFLFNGCDCIIAVICPFLFLLFVMILLFKEKTLVIFIMCLDTIPNDLRSFKDLWLQSQHHIFQFSPIGKLTTRIE